MQSLQLFRLHCQEDVIEIANPHEFVREKHYIVEGFPCNYFRRPKRQRITHAAIAAFSIQRTEIRENVLANLGKHRNFKFLFLSLDLIYLALSPNANEFTFDYLSKSEPVFVLFSEVENPVRVG